MNGCMGNTSVTNLLWCKTSCHHREPAPYAWQASRCQPILGLSVCQTWKINYQSTWGINWLGRILKQNKARGKWDSFNMYVSCHVYLSPCVYLCHSGAGRSIAAAVQFLTAMWQLALLFVSKIWTQLSADPCVVFTDTNFVSLEISPVLSSHAKESFSCSKLF